MPGPVVHTIIAEQLPDAFESADEPQFDLSSVAADSRANREALVYGAQGPDPFFFNPNDLLFDGVAGWHNKWTTWRGQLSATLYEFTEPLREVKLSINDSAEETLDAMEDRSHVLDELTNLQARFKYLSTVISKVLRGFVKKTVLDHADPFGLYISPLQTCGQVKSPPVVGDWQQDHELWWWFDNLHSRRTGDFAAELLDIATGKSSGTDSETRSRPLLQSYGLGYLSHIAADVVGHAYVNTITGGPYRLNQSQRHTAQEKIMDVWAYDHYYDDEGEAYDLEFSLSDLHDSEDDRYYHTDEVVNSGMHKNFQFTIGDIEPKDWTPDPDRTFGQGPNPPIRSALKLPDEIADNFALAASRAYPDAFGDLTAPEVASSYRLWYKNFMSSTSTFGPVPPSELPGNVDLTEPVREELQDLGDEASDVSDSLQNLLDSIFDGGGANNLGAAAQCLENLASGDFSQEDVECLEAAAEAINGYIAQVATAVAELAKEVFDVWVAVFELVEAIASIPLRALNFLLQAAYEKMWTLYKDMLMLVSAIGFGSMFSEDLHNSQLKNMWDPQATDSAGRSAEGTIVKPFDNASGFPRKGMKAGHTVAPEEKKRLEGLENDAHLLVPFTEVEKPRTIPGPDVYGQNTPEIFINDPNDEMGADATTGSDLYDALPNPLGNDSDLGKDLQLHDYRAPEFSENPEEFSTDKTFKQPVLGDAVTLTAALYKEYEQSGSIPNLNMSGDRAIGYPTWANDAGCSLKRRQRWHTWHGTYVPWQKEPVEPIFVPDIDQYY